MFDMKQCVALSRTFYSERERSTVALQSQLKEAEEILTALVLTPLEHQQKTALLSLLSDILGGYCSPQTALPSSLLIKALNRKMYHVAAGEFFSFCFAQKEVEVRLWNKRQCEHDLFLTGRFTS